MDDKTFQLPSFREAETTNPRKLLLISHHKTGKTTLASGLQNSLLIDTEDGSDFVAGVIFNLQKESAKFHGSQVLTLQALSQHIRTENEKLGKPVYDYIVIDTITGLESLARRYATSLYKETIMGSKFKGSDVVTELPNGSGYDFLRKAFVELYKYFEGLAGKGLILMGHTKYSSITKLGKELSAKDVDLTGKLKQIVCRDMDAIGYLYRKENKVIVSFISHEQDLAVGARSPHLRNKELSLSEYDEGSQQFTFNWNQIYKED